MELHSAAAVGSGFLVHLSKQLVGGELLMRVCWLLFLSDMFGVVFPFTFPVF